MTDFSDNEISVESGRPSELYIIQVGSEIPYRFTSSEDVQVVLGETYIPEAIRRETTGEGQQQRAGEFSAVLPTSNAFVSRYLLSIPGYRVRMEVLKYHRSGSPTPTLRRVFKGFIESVGFSKDGFEAKISAKPLLGALKRSMPRFVFSGQCNHVLYDSRCQVAESDPSYRIDLATVDGADGTDLLVASAATFADGWFTAGYVSTIAGDDHRDIVNHVGNTLTLSQAFTVTPSFVIVQTGCDHTSTTCATKFLNRENFGGYPYVPTKDIWQSGIRSKPEHGIDPELLDKILRDLHFGFTGFTG